MVELHSGSIVIDDVIQNQWLWTIKSTAPMISGKHKRYRTCGPSLCCRSDSPGPGSLPRYHQVSSEAIIIISFQESIPDLQVQCWSVWCAHWRGGVESPRAGKSEEKGAVSIKVDWWHDPRWQTTLPNWWWQWKLRGRTSLLGKSNFSVWRELCSGGDLNYLRQQMLYLNIPSIIVCLTNSVCFVAFQTTFYRNKILLLDEATASVDVETDHAIQSTIKVKSASDKNENTFTRQGGKMYTDHK